MIVMITVGPRMATLTALMTSIFHAAMQNAGIDAFSTCFSSALVELIFVEMCDYGAEPSKLELSPG